MDGRGDDFQLSGMLAFGLSEDKLTRLDNYAGEMFQKSSEFLQIPLFSQTTDDDPSSRSVGSSPAVQHTAAFAQHRPPKRLHIDVLAPPFA